jgi:hypothetical protein
MSVRRSSVGLQPPDTGAGGLVGPARNLKTVDGLRDLPLLTLRDAG